MRRIRVIPVLLLQNGGLYKTIKFKSPQYLGDPINAVKIFNDKEVDEILVLDIQASRNNTAPDFNKLAEIAGEAFMPMGYGGGVRTVDDIKRILFSGYEKVVLNSIASANPTLVKHGAALTGAQSIVVCIDYKKNWLGKMRVYSHGGTREVNKNPVDFAREMEEMGAGEIILQSIGQDGTFGGYDLDVINKVSSAVGVPVVACGGAAAVEDFVKAINAGASAVAAGSLFVYKSAARGILMNYPPVTDLTAKLYSQIQLG